MKTKRVLFYQKRLGNNNLFMTSNIVAITPALCSREFKTAESRVFQNSKLTSRTKV